MQFKILAVCLALLFILAGASAQFYIMDSHEVLINVDSAGNAQISEKYFLVFQNEQQLVDFRQAVSQLGVSLDSWREYDSRIYPHIGQESDIVVSGISFIEEEVGLDFVEISYALKESIMEKKRETSRVIDYDLKTKFFNEFREGTVWVIPEGTTIKVQLPKGVEIRGTVKPESSIQENVVSWTGYVSGNELFLEYSFFKQIASFDLGQFIGQLVQSGLFWLFLVAAALILGVLLLKRKSISGRLEGYIIEHSDFGSEEEE